MPDSRPLFAKLCETVSYVNVFAYAAGPMSGCAVSRTGEVDESEAVHRNTPRIVRRGGEVQNDVSAFRSTEPTRTSGSFSQAATAHDGVPLFPEGVFNAIQRPGDTPGTQSVAKAGDSNTLGGDHIPVKNMMCAFGVPGYMIHGTPGAGFSVIPVDFSVAPGMYTT